MRIKVNGVVEETGAANLQELIAGRGVNVARVVIEHNLDIVPAERLAQTVLREDDVVEILNFIGGG